MERVQLSHPAGKKAITMEKVKYDTLKTSFLKCLTKNNGAPFEELQRWVEEDLSKRGQTIQGKLHWNLFWVTLDLEARGVLQRDKRTSPIKYMLK